MGATGLALERIDEAWRPLREAADRLAPDGLEQRTSAGWTAKELLSHVAFWDEAAVPVILYMLRGEEIPLREWFGSGYLPDPNAWPPADVHNAREAAWGREHAAREILERLRTAHESLVAVVGSLSDEEAAQREAYLLEHADHYREHGVELGSVAGG